MEFLTQKNSHIYVRADFTHLEDSLSGGTHLAIGAHPDDLEVMAGHGIIECLSSKDLEFIGVTCCTGSGSARGESFKGIDSQTMMELRRKEQINSAKLGRYACALQLGYESQQVKGKKNTLFITELKKIISKVQPQVIYTHNLMDKHQTHISVAIHVLEALRELDYRPNAIHGCEVWRGLDWVNDGQKVVLPIKKPGLIEELISIHKTQIENGKNYAKANRGRMLANATFFDAKQVDQFTEVLFAIDLLPLLENKKLTYSEFVNTYFESLQSDVNKNLDSFKGGSL